MRQARKLQYAELGARLRRYHTSSGCIDEKALELSKQLIQHTCPDDSGLVKSIEWYGEWVSEQVTLASPCLSKVLEGYISDCETLWQSPLMTLWEKIASYLRAENALTIDDIVKHLTDDKILAFQEPSKFLFQARQLVFAVIGWQTMLWKLELGASPPGQLAMSDEMNGVNCHAVLTLRQDQSACRRPLQQFLMGFGTILPSPLFSTEQALDEPKISSRPFQNISSTATNAFLLESVGNIAIKWTDLLTHHLELYQTSQTLYLFRFPSFCLANLPSVSNEKLVPDNFSPIYACGSSEKLTKSRFWASKVEIRSLLQETLLSYRLIFGQSKKARKLYRGLRPFGPGPGKQTDLLLHELCGRKQCELTSQEERENYNLSRDFPMYQNRLAILDAFLLQSKPHTWKQLWEDKRDSAQWFTFWVVLIFGGLGLIMAFIQVILQVVQLATS